MLMRFKISREKKKLNLKLLRCVNENLEKGYSPEMLKSFAELYRELNR